MIKKDPKKRFSDRSIYYKKYRPTYPPEIISCIQETCPVDSSWTVADIGSGTGISSKLLTHGLLCHVHAVEPNDAMRAMAEQEFHDNPYFHSVKGCAESTTLDNKSVDLVAAFQAFHWFEKEKTRAEFHRILKAPQWVLLVWNNRITCGTDFLETYEDILQCLPEYKTINHKNITDRTISEFLRNDHFRKAHFAHSQSLDFEGLKGRFLSSSYTPAPDADSYDALIERLENLFNTCNRNGVVEFKYRTEVFLGELK